jgi:hypothetical protein
MLLSDFIKANHIRATVTYGNNENIEGDNWKRSANPWTVVLHRNRHQMTVPFYTGSAITEEPDAATVLDCLASDASGFENARSFEDWAEEYGYDTDSRKAERIYKQVERQTKKLQHLLGTDLYNTLLWDTERL